MGNLSKEEYIEALERLKKSPRDRIGILGDLGVTAIGAIAGSAAAGSVAGAAGAATLMGSSTAASILGGIFVTTTPVGWVVGTALAGGAVGYGVSRLVRSGGKSDARKHSYIRELEKIAAQRQKNPVSSAASEAEFATVVNTIEALIRSEKIPQSHATRLLEAISAKKISSNDAFSLLENYQN